MPRSIEIPPLEKKPFHFSPLAPLVPRYGYNDWRDAAESERVLVDKRKKLLRAIPTSIPGVTGILKGQAKRDLREMGAFVDMKVRATLEF